MFNLTADDIAGQIDNVLKLNAANESAAPGVFPDSLNIPRAEMPQIRRDDFSAFEEFAKERGVSITEETANAADLKPTQNEYNPEQVAQLPERAMEKPLTVSSDNRVLDGHNTLKKHQENGNKAVKIRRIDLPVFSARDKNNVERYLKMESGCVFELA